MINEAADLKSNNHSKRTRSVSGFSDKRNPTKKIAVRFNDEMFEAINNLSINHDVSFAHVVRRLCGVGLAEEAMNNKPPVK